MIFNAKAELDCQSWYYLLTLSDMLFFNLVVEVKEICLNHFSDLFTILREICPGQVQLQSYLLIFSFFNMFHPFKVKKFSAEAVHLIFIEEASETQDFSSLVVSISKLRNFISSINRLQSNYIFLNGFDHLVSFYSLLTV